MVVVDIPDIILIVQSTLYTHMVGTDRTASF